MLFEVKPGSYRIRVRREVFVGEARIALRSENKGMRLPGKAVAGNKE